MTATMHTPEFIRHRFYYVLLLTWLAYCAYVSSRRPFGVVRRSIEESEGLTPFQLGMVDTAFLSMYCVGQFFYGELKAVLSPVNTIAIGLVISACSLAVFSVSSGFHVFCLLWAVNGLANACGWPSCIRIITPWIRPEERGRVMGLWASCQAAGGIVGNAAAAYFLGAFGWRSALLQSAGFVALVGVLNKLYLTDHPQSVGFTAQDREPTADAESPEPGKEENDKEKIGARVSVWSILGTPGVTPVAISHFCEKIIRYTLLFWLPYYLTKRLGFDKVVAGYSSTAFDVGGVGGSIASGFVADSWKSGRRRVTVATAFLALAGCSILPFALWPDIFSQNLALPVTSCFLVGFFLLGFDSLLTGAVIQDIATRANMSGHVSAISGVIGGSGSFGSIIQGVMTTSITSYVSWEALWVFLCVLITIACISLTPAIRKEVVTKHTHGQTM
eukprot:TRINITY_DN20580_c0_g1_i1.p1 TRINITY_DN20580_c0_g1~~TRINITY_DN20580_c0_g1_i1.p1  ORF type:complete len:445 (+),score=54.81 TRINITY_DN20580_c0_g1_i1:115-1449(+)